MTKIIIEVDDALAKAWNNGSEELRSSYEREIITLLKDLQKAQFGELLDKAGKIAESNGLTEEKLNKLLNDED